MKLSQDLFALSIDEIEKFRKNKVRWAIIDGVMALLQLFFCTVIYFFLSVHLALFLSVGILIWIIESYQDKQSIYLIDIVLYLKKLKNMEE